MHSGSDGAVTGERDSTAERSGIQVVGWLGLAWFGLAWRFSERYAMLCFALVVTVVVGT
jgi:hypothetical protein